MWKKIKDHIDKRLENLYYAVLQSITTIIMAIIAVGFGKLYEFVWITIGYVFAKGYFNASVSYHATSYWKCTASSCIMFGIACAITPTSELSLLCQAILGVLIAYYMSAEMQDTEIKETDKNV